MKFSDPKKRWKFLIIKRTFLSKPHGVYRDTYLKHWVIIVFFVQKIPAADVVWNRQIKGQHETT